ncbi:hypothetical protein TVAG_319790 [Trichomonas vaginalis G3]|uniref:Uncharacterized protein n=1 Tax=Trichomonas vaginalis (strain ATCC PRA-98 / G3) TaxID=412133 RepID=A2DQC7_TRIV3|nr:hypothetical protein TVAGG3_1009620 [Trichomonas vaginalis G3]EAY17384.1 hypothetical protein TVAG_319790 [Trichomonas vaginalis G3]KAI5491394.1 hypothetical protein TVAGG3_1009620 [Trichomonas vaginalis G3]|eukprot:XP_001330753.1 hypothetical protein [Trichomonas vaginalis G3]
MNQQVDPLQLNIIQLYNPDFITSNDRNYLISLFGQGESYFIIPIIVQSDDKALGRFEILQQLFEKYRPNKEFLAAFYWKGEDFLVIELKSESKLIDEIIKEPFIINSKQITSLREFSNFFINRIIISYLTPNTIVKVHEIPDNPDVAVIFSNSFNDDGIYKGISVKRLPRIDYPQLNSRSMKLQSRLNEVMFKTNNKYLPPKAQFNAGAYPDVTKKGSILQNGESTDIYIWDNKKFKDEFEIVKIPYRSIEINPSFSSSEISSCLPAEKTLVQNYIKSKSKNEQPALTSISKNLQDDQRVRPPPPKVGQLMKYSQLYQNVIFMGFLQSQEVIYRPSLDLFTINGVNSLADVSRVSPGVIQIQDINAYMNFKKDRLKSLHLVDPYAIKTEDKETQPMTEKFSYPVQYPTNQKIPLEKLSIVRKAYVYKYDLLPGDLIRLKNDDNVYAIHTVNDGFTYDLLKIDNTIMYDVSKSMIETDQKNIPKLVMPSNNCLDTNQFRLMVHDKLFYEGQSWTILALHNGYALIQAAGSMKWIQSSVAPYEGEKPPSKKINTFVGRVIQTFNNEIYTIYEVDYDKGLFYCDKDHEISFNICDSGQKYYFT